LKLENSRQTLHFQEETPIISEKIRRQDDQVRQVGLAKTPRHLAKKENKIDHDLRVGRLQDAMKSQVLYARPAVVR